MRAKSTIPVVRWDTDERTALRILAELEPGGVSAAMIHRLCLHGLLVRWDDGEVTLTKAGRAALAATEEDGVVAMKAMTADESQQARRDPT